MMISPRSAYILRLLSEPNITRPVMVKNFLDRYGYIRVKELREDMHITNPADVIQHLRRRYGMPIVNDKMQLVKDGFLVNVDVNFKL